MKHNVKITIILVSLFLLSQVIGLAITNRYIDYEATKQTGTVAWEDLPSVAGVKFERPQVEASKSVWYIMAALVAGTVLILLIIRFKKPFLWRLWFFLAVALCLQVAFGAFIPGGIALPIGIILTYFKIYRPNIIVHNFTELFVYGGLAAIFVPIINLFAAFTLLIILSLYDMYAVWKSKHMIKMAKFQTKSRIFAGLLLPYKRIKAAKGEGIKKKVRIAMIGGGDVGFPLIFAGVVMKTFGLWKALIIPPFVTIALLLLLVLGKKERFYPAMPFLSVGCLVGYGIVLLANFFF